MYSSEDLKLFFQVLDGVLASWGVCPVVLFKKMIPYNFFQKRYKEIRKKIVAVKVDGLPSDDLEFLSQYCKETLNYLRKFWNVLFAFLDDGEFPVDNNLAGRSSIS